MWNLPRYDFSVSSPYSTPNESNVHCGGGGGGDALQRVVSACLPACQPGFLCLLRAAQLFIGVHAVAPPWSMGVGARWDCCGSPSQFLRAPGLSNLGAVERTWSCRWAAVHSCADCWVLCARAGTRRRMTARFLAAHAGSRCHCRRSSCQMVRATRRLPTHSGVRHARACVRRWARRRTRSSSPS